MPRTSSSKPELDASMPVVVLHGKESFLVAERTNALRDALREEHGEFEEFRFDGAGATLAEVLDELRSYGLMQRHKLVIVDEADEFLKADDTRRPAMERYAENPQSEATLLLRARTWRPGRIDKIVKKSGAVIKCEELKPHEAAAWAVRRAASAHGVTLARPAATSLVDRLGADLTHLDTEIAKLAAAAAPGNAIDEALVASLVGMSREEMGWVIQEAVSTGDPGAALTKVRELVEISRAPAEMISWSLIDLARKVHAASRLLRDRTPPGTVMKQLKLWGGSGQAVVDAARRRPPAFHARRLRETLEDDRRFKTGLAVKEHAVEAQAVRLADTFR